MSAAPDLVEAVIGFRAWRIAGDRLLSPYIPCRWEGREMHAECFPANRQLLRGVGWLDAPHASPHPTASAASTPTTGPARRPTTASGCGRRAS
jgi:hypothetical protein